MHAAALALPYLSHATVHTAALALPCAHTPQRAGRCGGGTAPRASALLCDGAVPGAGDGLWAVAGACCWATPGPPGRADGESVPQPHNSPFMKPAGAWGHHQRGLGEPCPPPRPGAGVLGGSGGMCCAVGQTPPPDLACAASHCHRDAGSSQSGGTRGSPSARGRRHPRHGHGSWVGACAGVPLGSLLAAAEAPMVTRGDISSAPATG